MKLSRRIKVRSRVRCFRHLIHPFTPRLKIIASKTTKSKRHRTVDVSRASLFINKTRATIYKVNFVSTLPVAHSDIFFLIIIRRKTSSSHRVSHAFETNPLWRFINEKEINSRPNIIRFRCSWKESGARETRLKSIFSSSSIVKTKNHLVPNRIYRDIQSPTRLPTRDSDLLFFLFNENRSCT